MPFDFEGAGDFELAKNLRTLKVTINLGVKDGYLDLDRRHERAPGEPCRASVSAEMKKIKTCQARGGHRLHEQEFNSLITGTKKTSTVCRADKSSCRTDLETDVKKRIITTQRGVGQGHQAIRAEPGARRCRAPS
jgi:hypothetical protein